MPVCISLKSVFQALGHGWPPGDDMDEQRKPFSSQWFANPAAQQVTGRIGASLRAGVVRLFTRRPFLNVLPVMALVLLVTASSFIVYPRTILPVTTQVMSRSDLSLQAIPTSQPVKPRVSVSQIGVKSGNESGPVAQSSQLSPAAAVIEPTATVTESPIEGSLLPTYRILLVYGLPGDSGSGMLGSYENQRLLEFLGEKRDEYQKLDPNRPVILGVQLITSAAQKSPGLDGSYLRDTSVATIYKYVEFTRDNDMVLVLDLQIGRRTVPQDVQRINQFLLQPHVHLAIDPEFNVERTEIPTQDVGSIRAADIRWVQEYLANLTLEAGLPPKMLIVHLWSDEMIENRPLLRAVQGVQLVLNASLWGDVATKSASYGSLITDVPVEFGGIMISAAWDDPAMTTEDVINLPHAPEIVIYQ